MTRLSLVAALALAGCASASRPAALPTDHPASPGATAAPVAAVPVALAPATEPVLPAALRPSAAARPDAMAGMDHGAMAPSAMPGRTPGTTMAGMDHGAMASAPAGAAASAVGLTATLDAYLAVHDALAADRLADAVAGAATLTAAVATLTAQPVPGDRHLWHTHADDLTAIRTHTAALTGAADIAAARVAFGTMSVPFIRLVQATGVPAGYDLALMRCGMAPGVPDGGVWVQRAGTTANPFFGASMPRCGSRTGAVAAPVPSTNR